MVVVTNHYFYVKYWTGAIVIVRAHRRRSVWCWGIHVPGDAMDADGKPVYSGTDELTVRNELSRMGGYDVGVVANFLAVSLN